MRLEQVLDSVDTKSTIPKKNQYTGLENIGRGGIKYESIVETHNNIKGQSIILKRVVFII